jgi:RNA polymerase sigma-70 factor (ECF subfamily)
VLQQCPDPQEVRQMSPQPTKDVPAETSGAEFTRLTDGFRPELLAHCYRMLGSVHDAEDLVQETYLRAWRSFDGFEGRSSLRAWLYRIATNSCLTAIQARGRRPLPSGLAGPSEDVEAGPEPPRAGMEWIQPFPDAAWAAGADPADIVQVRGTVRLALVAAMQHLSAKERAALILREVAGFSAAEVAELLGTTTAAVNSALQRARTQLAEVAAEEEQCAEPAEPRCRAVLDRYIEAFERADLAALPELLRADVIIEMPPSPTWFTGREDLLRFLAIQCFSGPDRMRLVPISANGQPAIAAYLKGPDGQFHAQSLQVLTVTDGLISHIVTFFDTALFPTFGLALTVAPTRSTAVSSAAVSTVASALGAEPAEPGPR